MGLIDEEERCTIRLDQAACVSMHERHRGPGRWARQLSRDTDDNDYQEQNQHRYETLVAARGGACSCARVEKKQKQQQNGNGRKGDNAEGAPADADTDFQLAPAPFRHVVEAWRRIVTVGGRRRAVRLARPRRISIYASYTAL